MFRGGVFSTYRVRGALTSISFSAVTYLSSLVGNGLLQCPPPWSNPFARTIPTKGPSVPSYKVFYSGVEGEHLTQGGGTKLPPDDVVLLPGWNWIGYAPLVSRDVNSVIEALSGNFTYDDQFKTRRGASVSFCTYSGSTLGFVGDLVELKPGVGYEVKVSRAITFAYTTTVET